MCGNQEADIREDLHLQGKPKGNDVSLLIRMFISIQEKFSCLLHEIYQQNKISFHLCDETSFLVCKVFIMHTNYKFAKQRSFYANASEKYFCPTQYFPDSFFIRLNY